MRQTGKQVEAKVKHATKEKQARTAAKVKVLKAERGIGSVINGGCKHASSGRSSGRSSSK